MRLEKAILIVAKELFRTKFKWDTIRISAEEPDLSSMPTTPYEWEESDYGKVKELDPRDQHVPLGKCVETISYHDKNVHHNTITERLVTGVLKMLNKNPVN